MAERPLDEWIGDLRRAIHHDVAGGFYAPEDIVERAVQYLSDDAAESQVRPLATELTDAAFAAHRAEQIGWPRVTDYDRLEAAFDQLEATGILARHNYSCCGTCGAAEIWDELQAALDQGRAVRGYTFYHEQDTEAAVDGDGIFLNYGSAEDSKPAIKAMAEEIIAALRTHGLEVEWAGSLDKRIQVRMVWQRRRS